MANYDTLKNTLQSNVYQNSNNAVTGAILQNVLMAFINTMGTGSNFMGFLSAANKPTSTVDGKQFYIGYNASTTALSIDLSAVGLGMLSITRSKLYVVHNIGGTWAAVDIAAGIAGTITAVQNAIPTNVSQLDGIDAYEPLAVLNEDHYGEVNVVIDKLESNTVYVIDPCDSLDIQSYDYDNNYTSLTLPPSYIYVTVQTQFTLVPPPVFQLHVGDSLTLEAGKTYLITIRGILWSIEEYA